MAPLPDEYRPAQVEEEVRAFWKTHHLPPPTGTLGPAGGPTVRQFVGTFTTGDSVPMVVQRALAADVDARYLALTGRRTVATLRREGGSESDPPSPVDRALERLGVWVGGTGTTPSDSEDRHARVERIVGQLARRGIIATRDLPLRVCPSCEAPRSPERIIYQEEEGDTYLVRFDVPLDGRVARALVWVDAPWRLLATSAILVSPDLPYVVARYRRRDSDELVFTSRSSLERFRSWIPDATFEVLEERPGREYAGRPYGYPLAHEFPMGGALGPPAGTVLAVPDVTDTGTGLVPLVPGHGATDAVIAEAYGIPGWPLVTPTGRLDVALKHKYAGLDLRTATEFIVRDLEESGAIFAQLRVRRGVPHCALCGSTLVWTPGRAWCLEPGRLSAELAEMYRRLLPAAPALPQVEVAPWPVSETTTNTGPSAVALLECPSCESLDSLDASPTCRCGGTRYPVRRRLVPSAAGVFAAWARSDPFPGADTARLYVGERRAVPTVVHHLMALAGVDGMPAEVGVTLLPTLTEIDPVALADQNGADAVRAALVRTEASGRSSETFVERWGRSADGSNTYGGSPESSPPSSTRRSSPRWRPPSPRVTASSRSRTGPSSPDGNERGSKLWPTTTDGPPHPRTVGSSASSRPTWPCTGSGSDRGSAFRGAPPRSARRCARSFTSSRARSPSSRPSSHTPRRESDGPSCPTARASTTVAWRRSTGA